MERDLVERARAGDDEAFEALVRSKVDALYHLALAVLGNPADAQDAIQEAFVSAWRRLADLRDADRFDAWLTRILVSASRDVARSRSRRRLREVPAPSGGPSTVRQGAGAASLPEEAMLDRLAMARPALDEQLADAERFDRAFERLSADERALLVLHHLEGRSVEDIGRRLDIPMGTVKSRLHRARARLEAGLREDGG